MSAATTTGATTEKHFVEATYYSTEHHHQLPGGDVRESSELLQRRKAEAACAEQAMMVLGDVPEGPEEDNHVSQEKTHADATGIAGSRQRRVASAAVADAVAAVTGLDRAVHTKGAVTSAPDGEPAALTMEVGDQAPSPSIRDTQREGMRLQRERRRLSTSMVAGPVLKCETPNSADGTFNQDDVHESEDVDGTAQPVRFTIPSRPATAFVSPSVPDATTTKTPLVAPPPDSLPAPTACPTAALGSFPKWLIAEREAADAFSPMAEADLRAGCYRRPATIPREQGWNGIPEEMFDGGSHGVNEGTSVSVGSSSPYELLQGKGSHHESLAVLRRQGAIKVKCDDVWDDSHECSALLDLRWLHQGSTKLKSLRGHFSFLHQTLPRGDQPNVEMVEENRYKSGKTLFGDLLGEVDKAFKSVCSPYRGLGPKEREALFLKMLRSRMSIRSPYLTSVALDALNGSTIKGSERAKPPSGPHPWEPNSVADGEESILRRMLDTCEQRCTPREIINAEADVNAKRVVKKRKHTAEAGFHTDGSNGGDDDSPAADELIGDGSGRSALWGAGIISPWLYFMSMGSVFCCHIEDYAFGSANVIVAPPGSHSWVVWYSVPRQDIGNLHEYLRGLLGQEYSLDCLEQRKLWLDPASVAAWRGPKGERIQVYRHLQGRVVSFCTHTCKPLATGLFCRSLPKPRPLNNHVCTPVLKSLSSRANEQMSGRPRCEVPRSTSRRTTGQFTGG